MAKLILVTGSSGLIGSEVCAYFAAQGYAVHGVDNNQRAVFFGPQGDTRWNQQRLARELKGFVHHELDIRDRAGVLALVMQFTMTFLSMSTIVRERELGTLEQLIVSPIQPWELMLGKMIPLMTIGYVNVTAILLLAVLWFGVPIMGNVVLLYLTVFIFFFTTLGMGTLVSTIAKTYIQAVQLIQFFLMPSMLPSKALPQAAPNVRGQL